MATNKYFKVSLRSAHKQINKIMLLDLSLTISKALHHELETFDNHANGECFVQSIRAQGKVGGDYDIEINTPVHVISELGYNSLTVWLGKRESVSKDEEMALKRVQEELLYVCGSVLFPGGVHQDSVLVKEGLSCSSPIEVTYYAEMTSSLRGRPLHGTKFEVPSGYTGVIFNETKKSFTEDEDRELTATQSFDSFHYWNLDKEPSHGDRLHQALTWIDIAKALHSPVDSSVTDSQGSLKSEVSI